MIGASAARPTIGNDPKPGRCNHVAKDIKSDRGAEHVGPGRLRYRPGPGASRPRSPAQGMDASRAGGGEARPGGYRSLNNQHELTINFNHITGGASIMFNKIKPQALRRY